MRLELWAPSLDAREAVLLKLHGPVLGLCSTVSELNDGFVVKELRGGRFGLPVGLRCNREEQKTDTSIAPPVKSIDRLRCRLPLHSRTRLLFSFSREPVRIEHAEEDFWNCSTVKPHALDH